ncbi:MAG TPA: hypothetical protein VMV06_09705 [Acidimicrobiales bacterium]|nr:hypothetical protein [Acidimicrobiales bacterium]
MGYVVAGYVIVLSILFLYGVQLVWRRRRLTRAVERLEPSATPGDRLGGRGTAPGTRRETGPGVGPAGSR